MDNLDRTNVAQAALAKWTLERQLKALKVLHDGDSIDLYEDIIREFRDSSWTVSYGVLIFS